MTTKTFSKKFNAERAARAALGAKAKRDTDYRLIERGSGWSYQAIEATAEPKTSARSNRKVTPVDKAVATNADDGFEPPAFLAKDRARPVEAGEPMVSIADLRPETHPIAAANAASWPAGRKRGKAQRHDAAAEATGPRPETKLGRLVALLRRSQGVSIKEAAGALDWMEHSVRGAVAGSLKKKYGLTIDATKDAARGTVYRIAD